MLLFSWSMGRIRRFYLDCSGTSFGSGKIFGIQQGVVVVGEEAYQVTTAVNIQEAIAFLKHLGIAIVADPRVGVIALCTSLTPLAKYVVTHDRKLLVLVKDGPPDRSLEGRSRATDYWRRRCRSMFGVTPELLSALFALTDGPKPTVLSKRDALAVLRQSGTVNDTIADPLVFSSRRIRNVITAHRATILQRLALLSPKESGSSVHMDLQNFEISFRRVPTSCSCLRGLGYIRSVDR